MEARGRARRHVLTGTTLTQSHGFWPFKASGVALVLIQCLLFGAAACSSPSPEPIATRREPLPPSLPAADDALIRTRLLEELRTVSLKNCTLKRYGGTNDGGYLMCANLLSGVQSAYSYGIGAEDAWGCQVSRELDVPVHQYDCFTEHRPACDGGTFVFHDECVGPEAGPIDGQPFDTFVSQIAGNGDTGKPLLVKIDIEGAEWDSLMATPDEVLDTFVQLPMELHGVNEARFLEIVRRLKRTFHLVNLHFNNWACDESSSPLPGPVFQVLWVNKTVGVLDSEGPSPAPLSPLNAPDAASMPDCQLAPETVRR